MVSESGITAKKKSHVGWKCQYSVRISHIVIISQFYSLIKKKKITDISISEICDKAQVGRASFYRNYDSKEEVIEKHTEFLIRSWADQMDMDPGANIYNFFASLFKHFQDNSGFLQNTL